MRRFLVPGLVLVLTILCFPAHAMVCGKPVHALALYGEAKYGPDIKAYPYVNPEAPKGGKLRLKAGVDTFNSFNPFAIKGKSAALMYGLGAEYYFLFYEPLMARGMDEPFTSYCLICKTVEVAPDGTWEEFVLRREAKFHDGTPITADDVIFSFETLVEKGAPDYKLYWGDVVKAEKRGDRIVRFHFKSGNNTELPMIMGELIVLNKTFWTKHDIAATTLDIPVASGPYKVNDFEPGRFIVYRRDPNYWGRDLPLARGAHNFDEVRIEYFRDDDVAFEAFKAHQYDIRIESASSRWAIGYDNDVIDAGLMIKESVADSSPRGPQVFALNLRLSRFVDRRTREALALAFDFDWGNKNLAYGLFSAMDSIFKGSDLAPAGLPTVEERIILEKYRGMIPEEVFTKPFAAPRTDGSGNNRPNLLKARKLLRAGGWTLKDGVLVDPDGGRFEIEILEAQQTLEKWLNPYIRNLARLGIKARIRLVDQTQYINRMTNHEFEMTVLTPRQSGSPGNEQREYWGSDAADRPGSRNFYGVKDPVIDSITEELIVAKTRDSLVAHARALDRVLLWNYYIIPMYSTPDTWLAYWDQFGKPPLYPAKGLSGTFATWWYDPIKATKLNAKRKN